MHKGNEQTALKVTLRDCVQNSDSFATKFQEKCATMHQTKDVFQDE